jgi:hypothetical protein
VCKAGVGKYSRRTAGKWKIEIGKLDFRGWSRRESDFQAEGSERASHQTPEKLTARIHIRGLFSAGWIRFELHELTIGNADGPEMGIPGGSTVAVAGGDKRGDRTCGEDLSLRREIRGVASNASPSNGGGCGARNAQVLFAIMLKNLVARLGLSQLTCPGRNICCRIKSVR